MTPLSALAADFAYQERPVGTLLDEATILRERLITKERSGLAAIYRATGASLASIDADFQAPRFTCLVGDVPTFPIARLLNRVQREMRNFHGVFGLGDLTNLGGDAV